MENLPTGSDNIEVQSRPAVAHQVPKGRGPKGPASKKRLPFMVIAGLIALAIIGFAVWGIMRSSTSAHIDNDKYQAVFLSNGQVYFGKLERLNSSYLKLTDIFYIQSTTTDKADSENPQEADANKPTDVQLIKLGSEVHGPEDEMIIEKNQVLFFENLKKDGKVADSIEKYKADKN